MKNKKKVIALFGIIVIILTGAVVAFASGASHEHNYEIKEFNNGVITFKCTICGDAYTENFSDHINERDYAPLDVVPDGIINAKDYAYLMKHYGNNDSGGDPWEVTEIEIP